MPLFVVEDPELTFHDGTSGQVTLESNAPSLPEQMSELDNAEARHLAIRYMAGQGLPDPRINGTPHKPYAVTADGLVLTDPVRQTVASYRVDVPVVRRLV